MKTKEIRKKTDKECIKELKDKSKKLHDIRFAGKISQPKNVKEVAALRKDIARIKTILKEREI